MSNVFDHKILDAKVAELTEKGYSLKEDMFDMVPLETLLKNTREEYQKAIELLNHPAIKGNSALEAIRKILLNILDTQQVILFKIRYHEHEPELQK